METNNYIAAIDLGTSKIIGIIGSKDTEGKLTVHAIEKEDSAGSIKRGCIQNVEEAASRIKKIISKLENRISEKIEKVYVSIGGQSLHTVDHSVNRQLHEDTQITEELISSILKECSELPVYNAEIVEILPTEYQVDNRLETNPKGIFCSDIRANLKLIVARPSLKKNLNRCLVERVKIGVAGYLAAPLASAAAALTENEKNLGCVLIDFGAETTTVTIYKDNFLRYIMTIPFGGRNITRDICSLNVLEQDAERLKIAYGHAMSLPGEDSRNMQEMNLEGVDSSKIKYQTLARVIEARIEEIVENVIAQIEKSGYAKHLSAGIIITGGASQLKALPELLRQKTGMDIKRSLGRKDVVFVNKSEAVFNPAYMQAIGLLLLGTENCIRERETIEESKAAASTQPVESVRTEPKRPDTRKGDKKNWNWGGWKDKVGKLFEEDDSELH